MKAKLLCTSKTAPGATQRISIFPFKCIGKERCPPCPRMRTELKGAWLGCLPVLERPAPPETHAHYLVFGWVSLSFFKAVVSTGRF